MNYEAFYARQEIINKYYLPQSLGDTSVSNILHVKDNCYMAYFPLFNNSDMVLNDIRRTLSNGDYFPGVDVIKADIINLTCDMSTIYYDDVKKYFNTITQISGNTHGYMNYLQLFIAKYSKDGKLKIKNKYTLADHFRDMTYLLLNFRVFDKRFIEEDKYVFYFRLYSSITGRLHLLEGTYDEFIELDKHLYKGHIKYIHLHTKFDGVVNFLYEDFYCTQYDFYYNNLFLDNIRLLRYMLSSLDDGAVFEKFKDSIIRTVLVGDFFILT